MLFIVVQKQEPLSNNEIYSPKFGNKGEVVVRSRVSRTKIYLELLMLRLSLS